MWMPRRQLANIPCMYDFFFLPIWPSTILIPWVSLSLCIHSTSIYLLNLKHGSWPTPKEIMAWLEREREVRETMISVTKGEIIFTKTNLKQMGVGEILCRKKRGGKRRWSEGHGERNQPENRLKGKEGRRWHTEGCWGQTVKSLVYSSGSFGLSLWKSGVNIFIFVWGSGTHDCTFQKPKNII